MLPSVLARQLRTGINDYIETTYPMANEPFRGSLQKMLSKDAFVSREPYVAVRLPFRVAAEMPTCFEAVTMPFKPYVHQERAFNRLTGSAPSSTVIATGTGSGKTECFLYPILDYCYKHRRERGIKALIIYPMNALASDQTRRIATLIANNEKLKGNITVGMYVGGEEKGHDKDTAPFLTMGTTHVITDHATLQKYPPDILMTNYKMLDYLLVRPKDAAVWQLNTPETLKYVAVDELHTFDGAQGTDLACLLRRLKARLSVPKNYLTCIGTSATLGSGDTGTEILTYARKIFAEPFDANALITEDRLNSSEFLATSAPTESSLPTTSQVEELNRLRDADDVPGYLRLAVKCFFPAFTADVMSPEGRHALSDCLLHHSFFHSLITLTEGAYYQNPAVIDALTPRFPALRHLKNAPAALDALYALISHARNGLVGHLRPFLNVQVQLWLRELRRLVAKVAPSDITYELSNNLPKQKSHNFLPVVNCRNCGITGWVSALNERQNATLTNLDAFYNLYFSRSEKISMFFPYNDSSPYPADSTPARLCPHCLQLEIGQGTSPCPSCGTPMLNVFLPQTTPASKKSKRGEYTCPCCGSKGTLSLLGVRSSTEISACVSQVFASPFNDDKKTLAFSDNVQDAAYRAGFFNARTWRFGFRTALQRYCQNGGSGKSLAAFQSGFLSYWHHELSDADFISYFIAPNMVWKSAYEDMLKSRSLTNPRATASLISEIEKRLRYEIYLEYGISSSTGRTLEKSCCSTLSFDSAEITSIASSVRERAVNELGILSSEPLSAFTHMVIAFLNTLRRSGAFADEDFFGHFTSKDGARYLLSNSYKNWLPGSGRNNLPRFLAVSLGRSKPTSEFDYPSSKKYRELITACCTSLFSGSKPYSEDICRLLIEESLKTGILLSMPSSPHYHIYGLNPQHLTLTTSVVRFRCPSCGTTLSVSSENAPLWEGAPCPRATCAGTLTPVTGSSSSSLDYYGRLYSSGDLSRINAKEHTGLLSRSDREHLETDFKRPASNRAIWDPNLLSCTPTLEMGIDVGDLSTVILCSMPPSESQFLQRSGRAGRKDGNSLTLAVANAEPHDLYFYAEPTEMISGTVTPPQIFLNASAVLERQFTAFCMDSWVKTGISPSAVPQTVSKIINNLDSAPDDLFPFNFMRYVQLTLDQQIESFMALFSTDLDPATKDELRSFAGRDLSSSPMYTKLYAAFADLNSQRSSLRYTINELNNLIKTYESLPKDSAYDQDIRECNNELNSLRHVVQDIENKNVFNFMSDEGLLPNYAFPEAGIILRAILYRTDADPSLPAPKNEKLTFEYSRGASAAISELAPNNTFYAGGRKLSINQVDLHTAEAEKWRLCPNCSHAALESSVSDTSCCPRCGSPAWADSGQVRSMLKVRMVYSSMNDAHTLIDDNTDNRATTFYTKQMLVDVDEAHDITAAYQMNNPDFNFGYEFVRKATLREINFGEADLSGETLSVSGEEKVRKGFTVCKYCGRIAASDGKINHARTCKISQTPSLATEADYEECLFLYREFDTEILRILIPATTLDPSGVNMESFVAAFMLGMREYFGNVDHLSCTVSDVPVPDADYRKQYLVIYDSVPGGTGYLKQLMHNQNALVEIFEKSLSVLENCSCKDNPEADGCYHCLFAYRLSRQIGSISRKAAIRMLRSILSGKANIEKIDKISSISATSIFDSELETMFLDAIRQKVGSPNFEEFTTPSGKPSYRATFGSLIWEIEPQVALGASDGVSVPSKPDFILRPVSSSSHKPVAVFTDGLAYHKNIVAEDTLKRESIRRSGTYRVWSLTYKDVNSAFDPQTDTSYYTHTLDYESMPTGGAMYTQTVNSLSSSASTLHPESCTSLNLLFSYLSLPDAESVFSAHSLAASYSLLTPTSLTDPASFNTWHSTFTSVNSAAHLTETPFTPGNTLFGSWSPTGTPTLNLFSGITPADLGQYMPATSFALIDDSTETSSPEYAAALNGFWLYSNLMQFSPRFIALSSSGLSSSSYSALQPPSAPPSSSGNTFAPNPPADAPLNS